MPRDAYVVSGLQGTGGFTGADLPFSIVGGNAPSDLNSGMSRLDPYITPQKGVDVVHAAGGGTVYLEGRFYLPDATTYFASKTDSTVPVVIKQNPDGPPTFLKLSNRIGSVGWTPGAPGVYTITCDAAGGAGHTPIGGAALIGSVGNILAWVIDFDWTGNHDSTGCAPLVVRRGFVPISASAAAAAAAANTAQGGIFLDNATGIITLGLPTGQAAPSAPNAVGVEYIVKARSAIGVLTSSASVVTPWTIDSLAVAFPMDFTTGAPKGCGVASQGQGLTVRNCDIFYSGVHGVSCGSGVKNITLDSNRYHGGVGGTYHEVFNPGTTTTATGNRSFSPFMGLWPPLGCDGLVLAVGTVGGALTHGDPGSIVDCEWVDPQVIGYIPPSGRPGIQIPFLLADGPVPSDPANPETYGARVRQTKPTIWCVKNGTGVPSQGSITHYAAFIHCRFGFQAVGLIGSFQIVWALNAASQIGTLFFDACEFPTDFRNLDGSAFSCWFILNTTTTVRARNPSFYDAATSHANQPYALAIYQSTPNGTTGLGLIISKPIIAFRDTSTGTFQVVRGDTGLSTSFVQFTNGEYFGIGATTWADDPARNTTAEWGDPSTGTIDRGAVVPAANPFADLTAATGLALTFTEQNRQLITASHSPTGINRVPDSGNYGASQYWPFFRGAQRVYDRLWQLAGRWL